MATSFRSTTTSSNQEAAREQVGEQLRTGAKAAFRAPNGDLIGSNYKIPQGDFAHTLGYAPATPEEKAGTTKVTGARALELALQDVMQDVGPGAVKRGDEYRNIHISWGRFANEPGRELDMFADLKEGLKQGPDQTMMDAEAKKVLSPQMVVYLEKMEKMQKQSRDDNLRYMEMQYKFQEMSKNNGLISNLMKTRHDAVTRSIRESH